MPNLFLDKFMIEMSWYDFQRTNQWPLRRTFFLGSKALPGRCAPKGELTGLMWIDGASMSSLNRHIDIFANVPLRPASEIINEVQHGRTIDRGLVCEGLTLLHV